VSEYLFPDNTVLCNFASICRVDLLQTVLAGRGRWTEAVAYEADQSSRFFPDLAQVAAGGWLNMPIEVSDELEINDIERVRRAVFGGTEDRPLQHLGEAQTCFLILRRPDLAGSWWVSDDKDALRYARHQGITTRETIDLVAIAVAYGEISAANGIDLMRQMVAEGRSLRMPRSARDLQD
jgi:predicted nucleic acid-binding protein